MKSEADKYKYCPICKDQKAESDFPYAYRGCKSVRKDVCRTCDKRRYLKKYHSNNIEQHKERMRKQYQRKREYYISKTAQWRKDNPKRWDVLNKRCSKEYNERMSDVYISNRLKTQGVPVTPETIEIKRLQIIIQRKTGFNNNLKFN